MSDNGDDLLGDDLGDQSLADYNLGNDEEDELLNDDYDGGQNVPPSVGNYFATGSQGSDFNSSTEYEAQRDSYQREPECVVPNITVEVPNIPLPVPTYAPYPDHAVPPAMPAVVQREPPQIVPTDNAHTSVRLVNDRALVNARAPQIRDIPDTLDKVYVPRGGNFRGRGNWRNTHVVNRNRVYRRPGTIGNRPQLPTPHIQVRQESPNQEPQRIVQMRSEAPQIQPMPEIPESLPPRPEIPHSRPDMVYSRPDMVQPRPEMVQSRPEIPHSMPEARSVPNVPNSRPNVVYSSPEMLPPRPEMFHSSPEMHRPRPEMHGLRPEMMGPRPAIHGPRSEMHGPRPEMHGPRPEMHGHRPEMLGPRIEMRAPRPEMYHPARPEMGPRPEMLGPRPEMYAPRQEMFQPRPEMYPQRPGMQQIRPEFIPRPEIRPFQDMGVRFRPPERFPPRYAEYQNRFPEPRLDVRFSGPRMYAPFDANRMPLPGQNIGMPVMPGFNKIAKKVLINPHFKGNFQPPVDGLTYVPTRIQRSPPPIVMDKSAPIKDIDDAAERFIAEQRDALARAANRKKRSPQRYIEDTTIEIKNDLHTKREDDLERRQQEFIESNRAGLRRRMRSPSPMRSPRRRDIEERRDIEDRRDRDEPPPIESEYARRVREQETLRDRVLRAKEVRRKKSAKAYHQQMEDREREAREMEFRKKDEQKPSLNPETTKPVSEDPKPVSIGPKAITEENKMVEQRYRSPIREKSPIEPVTPPRVEKNTGGNNETIAVKNNQVRDKSDVSVKEEIKPREKSVSPDRALTPPLPNKYESDDDLDLILEDIDDILSDDDDSGRFKEKTDNTTIAKKPEPPKSKPVADLRAKLPPKETKPKQRITFKQEEVVETPKTPPRKKISTTKREDEVVKKPKLETESTKPRQRIIFGGNDDESEKPSQKPDKVLANPRRVVLQRRKPEAKTDPTKPSIGIFSKAFRTAIATENRIVIKKSDDSPRKASKKLVSSDPEVEFGSDEDDRVKPSGFTAEVSNLPHGMTDTRLRTLAGGDIKYLVLDKEDRTATITFRTASSAETFYRKFNKKMVAASRLSVDIV